MNQALTHKTSPDLLATLIVTPRERWGLAEASLVSVRDTTQTPFELIYIDGGMPSRVRNKISHLCQQEGYKLLEAGRFLTPNEARNLGAQAAHTKYVVFIDNDVMVSKGWLDELIAEAEASGADVVSPITCQGTPLHKQIHQAGGTFAGSVQEFFAQPRGARRIDEQMFLQRTDLADEVVPRAAFDTQLCEFHCVLVRRDALERIGWLDEDMLATKEHLDFCMSIIETGGRVRIAPASVVTYVFPSRANPVTPEDYPYFMLRWSPRWQIESLRHFADKWGLGADPYFEDRKKKLQWRHMEGIVRPSLNKVPVLKDQPLWHQAGGKVMRASLKVVSELMALRHAALRRRAEP